MAIDAPDYVGWTQVVEIVSTTIVPASSATETPAIKTEGKITNTDQTYQTLATWTVTADKAGILYGIELYSSSFSKTRFRLTIGGVEQYTDVEWPTAVNHFFAEARLPAETVVLLEGKSSDGTSVDMWGIIEGKEVG
jgi:hypothetical protein